MEMQISNSICPQVQKNEIYGKIKSDIGKILRKLCDRKSVIILEAIACSDYIHRSVSIPLKYAISDFIGYLKGKVH